MTMKAIRNSYFSSMSEFVLEVNYFFSNVKASMFKITAVAHTYTNTVGTNCRLLML